MFHIRQNIISKIITYIVFLALLDSICMRLIKNSHGLSVIQQINEKQASNNYIDHFFGNLSKTSGISLEQCQPGSPDFLKFLGKTNAILNNADETVQSEGFCFKS